MRRLAIASCLCLLLAGCSSSGSPQAQLQTKMNAIAKAANDKNANELRGAVADFLQEVHQQSANADISLAKAQDLQTIATRLSKNASVLEQTAASPTPTPSPSESPSPSPSPSPAPSPSPSPSPTEASPSSAPSPIIEISSSPAGGVLSPAATP